MHIPILLLGIILVSICHADEELRLDSKRLQLENQDLKLIVEKQQSTLDQLINIVEHVQARLDDHDLMLQVQQQTPEVYATTGVGDVYTHWGRTTCAAGSTSIYAGLMGKSAYSSTGGGINAQCMPIVPEYMNYVDGDQTVTPGRGLVYGAEYEGDPDTVFDTTNLAGTTFVNQNIPCSVCHVANSSIIMIPAVKSCPSGWQELYWGYLVSEKANGGSSDYQCMDNAPQDVIGGSEDEMAAHMYLVEMRCGTALPCPDYVDGRELTCVVCYKL